MRTVSRLNKEFGIRVNVRVFYSSGTVASVAAAIDGLRNGGG
jgi:hypothetical protein